MDKLTIDPEFAAYMRTATEEEDAELLKSIRDSDNTCLDTIKVWRQNGSDIILDGHRRYGLFQKHPEIAFATEEIDLPDRAAAFEWIYTYQFSRRNWVPTAAQLKSIRGKWYNAEKKARTDNLKSGTQSPKGQNGPSGKTAEKVALATGTSPRTVKRDAARDRNLGKCSPDFQKAVLDGKVKVTDAKLAELAELIVKPRQRAEQAILKAKKPTKKKPAKKKAAAPKKPAKPVKALEGRERDAHFAKQTLKTWSEAAGRWLSDSPSIDDYREQFPGKLADRALAAVKECYEALNAWQKGIK